MSEKITLIDAVKNLKANSYAILYSPKNCWLALFDGKDFIDESGKIDISDVYEARVFNAEKELRWVNEANGKGKSTIISDANFTDAIGTIRQNYLLWGQSTNTTNGNWTQFAEARIGAFFVPIKISGANKYAHFTAVEYLREFEDGNVAVFEERLTGISEVK